MPPELVGVDVVEHIGQKVNLDLQFTAENGYQVPLRQFFQKGKPVLLNLVYYRCPMLCNLVLNGQTAALRELAWTAGKEFEIVTISIAPEEQFDLAQAKKKLYLETYGRQPAQHGWHFLTDYQGNTKRLADQVGFQLSLGRKDRAVGAHGGNYDADTGRDGSPAICTACSSRSAICVSGLTEASEGKLGTVGDKLLLFCFHYDPEAKGYVPFARNIMKVGGGLMVLLYGNCFEFSVPAGA